jgi:hypothetical protein
MTGSEDRLDNKLRYVWFPTFLSRDIARLGTSQLVLPRRRHPNMTVTAMHRDLDVFMDPVFWITMVIGILPLVVAGAELIWITS